MDSYVRSSARDLGRPGTTWSKLHDVGSVHCDMAVVALFAFWSISSKTKRNKPF